MLKNKYKCGLIAVAILIFSIFLVLATDTGYKSPTATGSASNSWTNPTNAYTSDNQYAIEATAGEMQDYYNFGFNVPIGATINGIEVAVEGYAELNFEFNGDAAAVKMQVSNDFGSTYSTAQGISFTTAEGEVTHTYGGATNLWGLSWASGDFANTDFMIRIEMDRLYGGATAFNADHIQVKVYYTGGVVANCWSYSSTYGYYIPKGCTCYISGNAAVFNLSNAFCWESS